MTETNTPEQEMQNLVNRLTAHYKVSSPAQLKELPAYKKTLAETGDPIASLMAITVDRQENQVVNAHYVGPGVRQEWDDKNKKMVVTATGPRVLLPDGRVDMVHGSEPRPTKALGIVRLHGVTVETNIDKQTRT